MSIAAIPEYINRQDLSTASPGLRFGMYLPLWGINDVTKRSALEYALKLNRIDQATMAGLVERQSAVAAMQSSGDQVLTLEARSIAPFSTGLGNEHPLENGFAFLNPYGLPYLPGSGVKGVLRQAAWELANGEWGDARGWEEEGSIEVMFGKADSQEACRGALSFWDVIPLIKGHGLQVEVMTAHHGDYYQFKNGDSPHDSEQPIPIHFLSVPPGSAFTFHVVCDHQFLTRIAPEFAEENRWKPLLHTAFSLAFDWLGFGAKTAVGYGAMALDAEAEKRRKAQAEQRIREQVAQAKMAEATAGLPDDAVWVETQIQSGEWSDNNVYFERVENILEGCEGLSAEAYSRLVSEMDRRWPGIMADPDAVHGKKKKPKFKSRPSNLAKRIRELEGNSEK